MAEEKKSESKQLKEKLFASKKHGALRMSEDDQTACETICKDYMAFLNQSKTEREACASAEALLKEHGFVPFTPGTFRADSHKPSITLARFRAAVMVSSYFAALYTASGATARAALALLNISE